MVHPDTELRHVNDRIGYGVFATRLIPRGTIIWVHDDLDQAFTQEQVEAMAPHYREILDKYSFVDGRGRHILCWDHARFFNHSCQANCLSGGYDFEIAVRDIHPGAELLDDYGALNLREPFACACGQPECREWIQPDDMDRLAGHWDGQVEAAFPMIHRVAQPLWRLVKQKPEVDIAIHDPQRLRSIRWNYCLMACASQAGSA